LANEKDMNAMSGDIVETTGIYSDPYGHEIELKVGEEFPMDPQLGKVEYTLTALSYEDWPDRIRDDALAAEQANVPISAVQAEEEETTEKRQLKHRLHGGNR
jgi:hypothetical protein